MAYIRAKKHRSGKQSYYVVEAVRSGSKVRQKVLACIGEEICIEDAIAETESSLAFTQKWMEQSKQAKSKVENDGHPLPESWHAFAHAWIRRRRRDYIGAIQRIGICERKAAATEKRLALLKEILRRNGNIFAKAGEAPLKRRDERLKERAIRMAEIDKKIAEIFRKM